jgi:hypothetical protein
MDSKSSTASVNISLNSGSERKLMQLIVEIRLIFNCCISDDDFFQNSMRIIDTNFFSGDFQGQEGVRIMHQCALCNPKSLPIYALRYKSVREVTV